jgi:2'-5' RNA ligase
MRLFVGIELPESVRAAAAAESDRLRVDLRRCAPGLALRWVEPSNLHVTIWFIGEVTDERAAVIRESLDRPCRTPSFRLEIGGAGAYPPTGPPRVIWLGVRAGMKSLQSIHDEVEERLVGAGLKAERRPYSAHVTLARVKAVHRSELAAARRCLTSREAFVGSGRIQGVTLFRSRTAPGGSQYERLLHVPLR